MKPLEIHYQDLDNTEKNSAIQAILDSTDDIESFISNWFIQQKGTLTFARGVDNATGKISCLCLIVEDGDEEIAELCYPLRLLRKRFPKIRPIDTFIEGFDPRGGCLVNEFAFDEFERGMGYRYNDELCGRLGPRDSLLKVALSYVMARHGEVQLSHFEPIDVLEPGLDMPVLDPNNIMTLSLIYQSPKPVHGCVPMFGNFLYVDAERQGVC